MAAHNSKGFWFCTKETFKSMNTLTQNLTKLSNSVKIGDANYNADKRYIEDNIKGLTNVKGNNNKSAENAGKVSFFMVVIAGLM